MFLHLTVQRLISDAFFVAAMSSMVVDLTLTTWFPWLRDENESKWTWIDGPETLGYFLVQAHSNQSKGETYLDLDVFRKLIELRNSEEGAEGEEVLLDNLVKNWRN